MGDLPKSHRDDGVADDPSRSRPDSPLNAAVLEKVRQDHGGTLVLEKDKLPGGLQTDAWDLVFGQGTQGRQTGWAAAGKCLGCFPPHGVILILGVRSEGVGEFLDEGVESGGEALGAHRRDPSEA